MSSFSRFYLKSLFRGLFIGNKSKNRTDKSIKTIMFIVNLD